MMISSDAHRGGTRLFLRLGLVALICLLTTTGGRALAGARPSADGPGAITPEVYLHVTSPVIPVGQTGQVVVRIRNIRDLAAFEYKVTYDPSVLEVVDADLGKPDVQIEGATIFAGHGTHEQANLADNGLGVVHHALMIVGREYVTAGYADLGTITFRAKASQNSDIVFMPGACGLSVGVLLNPIEADWRSARVLVDAASAYVPLALKNAN